MYKYFKSIISVILICIFLHTNVFVFSQSTWIKKTNDVTADSSCLYIVNKATSDSMINHFKAIYSLTGKPNEVSGLSTESWIDKCVFISLYDYISKYPETYDGIRISWADPYRSDLIIVPTTPVSQSTATFKHTNRPDVNIPDLCKPASRTINNKPGIYANRINDFGENFREEKRRGDRFSAKKDSLSVSIWFDYCVLKEIVKELKKPQNQLDGMMAFAAAYLKKDQYSNSRGQLYDNQSTIILVPTKRTEGGHEPNWNIFNKQPAAGINHGQLCPQICD